MKADLLIDGIYITLLNKILVSIYMSLMNIFFELASILTQENGLYESNSPEEALLLLQKLYQLILQI